MLNVALCDCIFHGVQFLFAKTEKMELQVMGWWPRVKHMACEVFVWMVMTL